MRKAFALRLGLAALLVFPSVPLRADEPDAAHRAELQQRLDAKLAELEAVQREVQQLQQELNFRPQLMVHVKMFEVSLTKMEQLGIRWEDFLVASKPEKSPGAETFGLVDRKALDVLFAKNLARLEADPTLVTVVGRPAMFNQGGETPVGKTPDGQLKYEPFGTHAELLGTLVGKDRIQLEITAENSVLDHARPIEIDGKKYPGRRVSKIQTSPVLKSGESMLLSGRTEERTEATLYTGGRTVTRINKIQSMMLVTVELLDAPLQGVSTVNLHGQQPPQPAGTGYASGGVQTTLAAPQPDAALALIFTLKRLEIDLTKLSQSQPDLQFVDRVTGEPTTALNEVLRQPDLVNSLISDKFALLTCDPQLVSVPGRPNWFNVGGEVPVVLVENDAMRLDWQKFGTFVEVIGFPTGEDRLRLELKFTQREVDESRLDKLEKNEHPMFLVSTMLSTIETRHAQTSVVWERFEGEVDNEKLVMRRSDQQGHDIRAVWLITPDLIPSLAIPSVNPAVAPAIGPAPYPTTNAARDINRR